MVVHARRAFLSGRDGPEVVEHVAVGVDAEGRIAEVRPARPSDPPAEAGLLVPGLVNAHLHLELSWAAGQVPGGEGLVPWVWRLRSLPPPADAQEAAARSAQRLVEAGTALVCDVSNAGDTAPLLAAAGLRGLVQHELLGMHGPALADRVSFAEGTCARRHGGVAIRPSPHGTYSTPEPLFRAAARPMEGLVASVHLAEDAAENAFLRDGTGPFARLLDDAGIDWGGYGPPGMTPTAWVQELGLLGPDLLLVHGVHLTNDDRSRVASAGAAICLCARSNLHIGGRLPDVPGLLEAGIPLCLGTDSLASSPDLDVLGEVAVLARAFPDVPASTWLQLATAGGAQALRQRGGEIAVGEAPGLLLLEGVDRPEDLADVPPRRRLVPPSTCV